MCCLLILYTRPRLRQHPVVVKGRVSNRYVRSMLPLLICECCVGWWMNMMSLPSRTHEVFLHPSRPSFHPRSIQSINRSTQPSPPLTQSPIHPKKATCMVGGHAITPSSSHPLLMWESEPACSGPHVSFLVPSPGSVAAPELGEANAKAGRDATVT